MPLLRGAAVGLGLVIAFALVPAPPAFGLSCLPPPDWAELRIVDAYTREDLARVAFYDTQGGYACNVGNAHDTQGRHLVWIAADHGDPGQAERGAVQPGTVHVLDLWTGAAGKMAAGTNRDVHAVSVLGDTPQVNLLTRGSDGEGWSLVRQSLELAVGMPESGGTTLDTLDFPGDQAVLNGRFVTLLENGEAERPRITIHDVKDGSEVLDVTMDLPSGAKPPWRLLDGDDHWVVLSATALYLDTFDQDPTLTLWVHDLLTGRSYKLPPPTIERSDDEHSRYGAFRIDGDRLFNEVWQYGWSPDELQVRVLPDGTPQALSATGLMRDVAVDQGRLVVGNYLEEPPTDMGPWLSAGVLKDRTAAVETSPGAGVLFLVGFIALAMVIRVKLHSENPGRA